MMTTIICSIAFSPIHREASAKDQSLSILKKVIDWQLLHPKHSDVDWTNATLFTGVMALYEVTKDARYLSAMLEIGKANHWMPGRRKHNVDDLTIGQTYIELYMIEKDSKMIAPLKHVFDKIIAAPRDKRLEWWYCDALFMVPPALARLSAATEDQQYLDYMNEMWWDTADLLYDTEEHLFFHSEPFLRKKDGSGPLEKNGQKIFWGRGNGWVIAGIVRVLQYMPEEYPARKQYITLLREISERLADIQCEDGLWRSSLLDPDSYPGGETSGSGLICYAIAWGVNNSILDRQKYMPVVEKTWEALVGAVHESGKLGWVQPIGNAPRITKEKETEVYGVGAFLLAGAEMHKLSKRNGGNAAN
ncbi:MAG: glycoside hydrolase family 88 protein [Candidatus Latescibacterota bacterium]